MSESLYQRLGGGDGIAAIANDVVDNHLKNPLVSMRFQQNDPAQLKKLAAQFFCTGTGGPEAYEGRDMRSAHLGMNINEQEYMSVMDDVVDAMGSQSVGAQEQSEVIAILYSLKGEILRV